MSTSNFHEWAETTRSKWEYWSALKRARDDFIFNRMYSEELDLPQCTELDDYLLHKYGVKPIYIEGSISKEFIVVDPKKFMLFQLKYWL